MSLSGLLKKITNVLRNGDDKAVFDKLKKIFKHADREAILFSKRADLHCLPGCGRCCENPRVETTVLEFMPLADELWKKGEALQWLDKIDQLQSSGICVFYKPDPLGAGRGRCGVYQLRPNICRLYGFSAGKDKRGVKRLITCEPIKTAQPRQVIQAKQRIQEGMPVPTMQHFAMKVFQLHPFWGREQLPINQAIKIALEKAGLKRSFLKA